MIIYKGETKKYYNEDLSQMIEVYEALDPNISDKYIAHTMIGQYPYQFNIPDALTLHLAFKKFDETLEAEIAKLKEEAERVKQEQTSRIIVPDQNIFTGK